MSKYKRKFNTRLLVIDPQHFHAALILKANIPSLSNEIKLFAPDKLAAADYISLVREYNSCNGSATNWHIIPYYGVDFLEKAVLDKSADIVVLAGDNNRKITYMVESIKYNKAVFADKPLVINEKGYAQLQKLLNRNGRHTPIVYDIMTERFDIKNILVKLILSNKTLTGGFEPNAAFPLIEFHSKHHFSKVVAGHQLIRPAMFFDINKQGEGIVDVTTHYIDLVQWMLADSTVIDIQRDLKLLKSQRWSTSISMADYEKITSLKEYAPTSNHILDADNNLRVFSNGMIHYSLFGVPISVCVQWDVNSNDGKGDQLRALFKTKKCTITIEPDSNGVSSIFVKPKDTCKVFEEELQRTLTSNGYAKVTVQYVDNSYKLIIPYAMYLSHEDHFSKALQQFLDYKEHGALPEWEKSFLLAKYYLTTQALKIAETTT